MDRERAKFILQSVSAEDENMNEPAVSEALALAASDPVLGVWLSEERATDAEFAALLADLEIPDGLKTTIYGMLDDVYLEPAEFDNDFMKALDSIVVPPELRDQALLAMEVEVESGENVKTRRYGFFKGVVWTGSVAAVLAVMVVVTAFFAGAGGGALAGTTPRELEYSAVEMLRSPFLSLDLRNDRQAALYEWLKKEGIPSPDKLPQGLRGIEGIGCKVLDIVDQKSVGSLVCYKRNGERIHLVMMERDGFADTSEIPTLETAADHCEDCDRYDGWAVTRWADAEHIFLMLSKMEPSELAEVF